MSWKDKFHPEAGGAEKMTDVCLSALVKMGHNVTLIAPQYRGSSLEQHLEEGYTIRRTGGKYSIYLKAWFLYFKKYRKSDLVIEEINAVPFFAPLFISRKKTISVVYHVAREVWFYQMIFPISLFCFIFEPLYYLFLAFFKISVFTISESTQKDLISYGINKKRIFITPIPNHIVSISDYSLRTEKDFTVLSVGSIRPMKRTMDIIKAFELAYEEIPSARLAIAGSSSGSYGSKALTYIKQSRATDNIKVIGFIDEVQKKELMLSSSVLALTSVKEGWCIVATEAHSQGLPTIVYNVNGLRDSTIDNVTGLIVQSNPKDLAKSIIQLALDNNFREKLGKQALEQSRKYTIDNTSIVFTTNFNKFFNANI